MQNVRNHYNRYRAWIKSLPLLLYSYIATEMLAPFFASFLILYSVFFLVRLIPLLDIVLELKIGAADFIRLFCYIFPYMLLYVIPMACMTGIILCFTRMSNEREILVFKACGVSLRQLLPPVLLLAFIISTLTGFFSVKLIPAGEISMKHLMFQLAKEKINKGLQERIFTEALGDLVIYADRIDPDEQWHGVYVSDMRNRVQPIIIMARRGHLSAEIDRMMVTVVLENGTLHNTDGPDNQIIRFESYQMQIPLRPPRKVGGDDVTTQSRGSMTQGQLLQAADRLGRDNRHGVIFLSEFHHRLTLPVGCFILSLLGLPLGLQTGPGRRAMGIPLGLLFFVLYYILSTTGRVLAEDLAVPVAAGMWMPNIIYFAITLLVFSRVEKEKPIVSLRIQNLILDGHDNFILPVFKFSRRLVRNSLHWRPGQSDYDTVYYPGGMTIHANPVEKIYHVRGCEKYDCLLCTLQFKNAEIAREAGFKPCPMCGD